MSVLKKNRTTSQTVCVKSNFMKNTRTISQTVRVSLRNINNTCTIDRNCPGEFTHFEKTSVQRAETVRLN